MKVHASLRSLKDPGSVVARRRGRTCAINRSPVEGTSELMAGSTIARDAQRRVVVARHAERQRELEAVSVNPHVAEAERAAARRAMAHAGELPGITRSSR